ncbi:MAG: hypothetical protein DDT36_01725 [Firmicutes bacterium]|nr:hypothetical protein [Bacillota bacterium]
MFDRTVAGPHVRLLKSHNVQSGQVCLDDDFLQRISKPTDIPGTHPHGPTKVCHLCLGCEFRGHSAICLLLKLLSGEPISLQSLFKGGAFGELPFRGFTLFQPGEGSIPDRWGREVHFTPGVLGNPTVVSPNDLGRHQAEFIHCLPQRLEHFLHGHGGQKSPHNDLAPLDELIERLGPLGGWDSEQPGVEPLGHPLSYYLEGFLHDLVCQTIIVVVSIQEGILLLDVHSGALPVGSLLGNQRSDWGWARQS